MFERIFAALAAQPGVPEQLMIDSTHLKALSLGQTGRRCPSQTHRSATSLVKKGLLRAASDRTKGGLNSKLHAGFFPV